MMIDAPSTIHASQLDELRLSLHIKIYKNLGNETKYQKRFN